MNDLHIFSATEHISEAQTKNNKHHAAQHEAIIPNAHTTADSPVNSAASKSLRNKGVGNAKYCRCTGYNGHRILQSAEVENKEGA